MNKIINFSLKNKFAVWLLTIIITVAGLYSGLNMKLETIPNITMPMVSITTVYPGATPEDVADHVSEPIEKAIQNLNGVNVVSSTSFQNASSVQVEYQFEKDMDEAEQEVKDVLASLSLPDGVNDPEVMRINFNAFPIVAISAANEKQTLTELTTTIEDEIVPALQGLDGVSMVQVSGQQVEEVQLDFNEEKMAEYGLDQQTVQSVIQGSNVTFPLGLYNFEDSQKSVVVDGNITTIEDLKAIEIPLIPAGNGAGMPQGGESGQAPGQPGDGTGMQPGTGAGQQSPAQSGSGAGRGMDAQPSNTQQMQPGAQQALELPTIKLGEIAEINVVGEAESISRTNGKEAIGLQIVKASDANTVTVANNVKEAIKEFEEDIDGLEIVTTFDQATPIEDSVQTMLSKAITGAAFAILIILLFLRDIKSTLISVISIPLSLLIAILLLNQLDITLNMMTLGAMTVAIGRVVDDSIVVIENIYRRMSLKGEKLKGKELVRDATKEMFMPIMSSTIVTIAVFFPLALVNGMVGELFMPFALTIVFALLASLLVAVTIVPMMAHSLFKKGINEKAHQHAEKPGRLAGTYRRILEWALNHKWITSGIAVLMLVGSLFLVPVIGVSFLPEEEQKMIITTYNPAPGETFEEVEKLTLEAEEFFQDRDGVKTVQFSLGGENPMNPGDTSSAMFFVEYNNDTENFEAEKEAVIAKLQDRDNAGEWASQNFSASAGSNEIVLFVYGESLEDIEPVVADIQDIMAENKDLKNIDSSISETYEEYTLVVNQEKLSKLGLTAAQVGMALSQNQEQPVLTKVESDGKELNVYVHEEEDSLSTVEELTGKTVQSPLGTDVAVSEVVEIQEGNTSDTVTRRDGRIYVQVSAELGTDDVAQASADVQSKVDKLELPANAEINMGGVTEDINETFSQLGLAMLAAIAIVYLVLVITFGGGLAPFAILFSLPFTIIGALLGLLVSGETISVSAMIGALMLIGIVVTNAIVLIDRVIHKENEGLTTRDAILEAGTTRLRPILMTAIATIGALLPLAVGMEGSGLISKGLGVTVIGGLTSSTFLTLLIVPIVYEAIRKMGRKKNKEV
ncbi:Swarming motility protein SwrC [Bacillus canaveralius]|uniref:Swarming motility protein SwrC n=1 Tax=Bacillus canaveralius TaxID=1403243 RepID=A0A2N5GMX7_9BACI|nr:efflux RND transporter permease subunit [Bacillus canaveralius]PLR83519.1 Swarming motility protein SwrC [Bacillus canaveralius]PLS00705.1 Swarming motility protein SwrC [Bacillus canaveralius]